MRILIIKTSALGDIIHAFPVLHFLKNLHSESQIDWVVEDRFSFLLKAHPLIARVIPINTKEWKKRKRIKQSFPEIKNCIDVLRGTNYDVVLDLQGNSKSGIVTAFAKSKNKVGFSWNYAREWPNCLFTNKKYLPPANQTIWQDNLFLAQSFFNDFSNSSASVCLHVLEQEKNQIEKILESVFIQDKKVFLICPGSHWKNKKLPLDSIVFLLNKIEKMCACSFLFAWGNQEEKEECNWMQSQFMNNSKLLPILSLPVLQYLMSRVSAVFAMDSMALHLCATTPTPSFGFFGPTLGEKYIPQDKKRGYFQGNCPYGKNLNIQTPRCPILRTCKTGACSKKIEQENLLASFEIWWRSNAFS